MKTVLLYPYLHTEDDGEDLRLSLRSVDTHLHLGRGVILQPLVVGDQKPSWLDSDSFVKAPEGRNEDPDLRTLDVVRKVYTGSSMICAYADLDDDFLLMNDDFILLEHRYGVVQTYNARSEHILANLRHSHPSMAWWRRGLEAAVAMSQQSPNEIRVYDLHVPMWMNAQRACPLMHTILRTSSSLDTPFPRTVYGNLVGWPDRDVHPQLDPPDADFVGSSWINLKDDDRPSRRKRLAERLPNPSRWEVVA